MPRAPKFFLAASLALLAFFALPPVPSALAGEGAEGTTERAGAETDEPESGEESPGPIHKLLLYLPNRALDLIDPFRLRLRVGPGFAAGVRATELADVYLGSYVSIFAGLPGPRMRPRIRLPIGLESFNGAEVSVADATFDGGIGPGYGTTEFGASLHFLLIGLDFGIDPIEIVDFGVGLLTFDIRDDDF